MPPKYSTQPKFSIPGATLGTVALSDIDEGTRYRKDLGDLSELIHSIRTYGLINPITVTPKPEGGYTLIAGGRRLAALRHLQEEETLVRIFPDEMSELELRVLELAENLQRKDMTWQEANNLQREIHRLQTEIHGTATAGPSKSGWRIEDTAKVLGVSKTQVQNSLSLAEKLEKYSSVLGKPEDYRTENDARKAVRTVEEAMVRAELAKRLAKKNEGKGILTLLNEAYRIEDAIEGLAALPSESFDFAEVDPPYGIQLPDIKNDNPCDDYKELDAGNFSIFNAALLREVYRVLKPNTFCVFWFGMEPWLETLYRLAIEADFQTKRMPIVWVKPNGQSLNPSSSLASAYETAFVLRKGQPILAKPGRTNVFDFAPVPPNQKHHPTQKPIELYQEIFQTFSFEGANCISPFAGSGAALIAAQLCHRTCMGFDLSDAFKPGYLALAQKTFLVSTE